ncbi:helix-turn-helix transcriptional regulator [Aquipseudomonas campi]|uniref:Helix-turn-helix transcriptional regulator n=1 Tax=Aquipseudomonas campi TaxID=2731681 RepID=A0A6M8FDZ1_9GAMM|nr:helix-turn-helix transcriptional regulator [Pseudomonas campi]QKE62402.1 helix-turn-helix transcriptional regulator [Pseudomonas campi]
MGASSELVPIIKRELKAQQLTYADLARELGMSESNVKRMLAKEDMPLSRVDAICRVLHLDFADLARQVADAQPLISTLSLEQEQAVVGDEQLMLVALCVLSQWTAEQMLAVYRLSEAELIRALIRLDRLGVIELKPLNRYRLKLAKTFRWQPDGPVMRYFRKHALQDYYAGEFAGSDEGLLLVHGRISRALAPSFVERLQRVAQEYAQQHLADQKLPEAEREGYTLVLAMRRWEFAVFEAWRR